MAIDPTAPLTPITPAAAPGSQPNSAVLQAVARAALATAASTLSDLAGRPPTDAAKPRQDVEQADKSSTRDAGRAGVSSSSGGGGPGPSTPRSAPQETRLMRAVRIAAADAVPRQAGLAPLMADVRAVLDRPDMPPEVRIAGETLMARLPRAFEMSTGRGLRKAVEQSGVFLEARLARSATPAPDGHATPVSPHTDLKAALLVFKGALSGWLARASPPIIEEREPAAIVADQPPADTDGDQPVKAPALFAAPPRPEAAEAAGDEQPLSASSTADAALDEPERAERPANSATPRSLALGPEEAAPETRLAVAQPQASPEDDVEPRFAAFLAPSKPTPSAPAANKPVSTVLGLLDLAETSPDLDDDRPAAPLVARGYGGALADPAKPKAPPPPFADGPMAGQRPTVSALPPRAAPEEIVRRLLKGASAALARQDLMQIASLREVHHDPETGEARPQPARVNLDIPFVTPQGVAVAQFEIARDGGGAGGSMVGPVERTYRARFSIDVEPLGPVHALVTLTGTRARVSLWAERAETIARLRAGEEALGAALRQAELAPEVAIHSGLPPVKDASTLGHFVDQAS